MGVPLLLSGLKEVAGRYDGYVIDLWGTVHDGVEVYAAAIDVLRRLRAQGVPVCMLSNAARSTAALAARLAGLGLDAGCYDHLVSSGQATIEAFRQPDCWHAALGRTYYLISLDDGEHLLEGLGYTRIEDPSEGAFVLNTGSTPGTDLAHYERVLRACARRNLPMICANPDLLVRIADRRIMCAGMIARRYETLGGEVRYHGKPDRAIYQECLKRMKRPAHAVLAVGDGLETDIAGARGMGMDSVFVLGGLHAESLSETGAAPALDRLQALFARSGRAPTYVIPYLRWQAPTRRSSARASIEEARGR
ncbi:MAG TPA: TIGR01459 family HAD-type hydrolase [Dongiaceae bacterium]|nr:TIGR01459 family HAD-type hydrolase [Dongiaceae bacterium]